MDLPTREVQIVYTKLFIQKCPPMLKKTRVMIVLGRLVALLWLVSMSEF
jgi:hypothetical protein